MVLNLIVVFVLLHSVKALTPTTDAENEGLLWNSMKFGKTLLEICLRERKGGLTTGGYNVSLVKECLLRRSLLALDRLRAVDHLEICRGVDLVKYRNESGMNSPLEIIRRSRNSSDGKEVDWWSQVIDKLDAILDTRILKIQMKTDDLAAGEGRRRHHYRHMYPLIMFSTIAIGMIAIPMGFQFLAVLGGKALLLAKLALILTSIQGLKKIATSNINYGLYHTPPLNPCKDHIFGCNIIDDDSFELTVDSDNVNLRVLFEDIVPRGHYDRSYYDLQEENQQRYQGGDGVASQSTLDLLHPLFSRSDRIK